MAYKTFANGFPLPASDLNNFLMNQSVIVFADAAARTTAIPSPVQGMLTYLVDTAAYESWNGSAFVSISNPGDITAVTAGTGLTGGGTSGDVTLNLDAAAVIPSSTVTTAQDLIVADGASSVTRLGVGTDDQVLSVVAGEVAWADAGGGGIYGSLIASGTISASLTISSIPATYKDLILVLQSFDSDGATPEMTVNGISSDYAEVFLRASSSSPLVSRNASGLRLADQPGNNSVVYANFLGYSLTTGYKTVNISWSGAWKSDNQALNTNRTFGGVQVTGAISSMSFSNLGSVGTYALYGVN